MVHLNLLSWNFPGCTEENHEKSVGITGIRGEFEPGSFEYEEGILTTRPRRVVVLMTAMIMKVVIIICVGVLILRHTVCPQLTHHHGGPAVGQIQATFRAPLTGNGPNHCLSVRFFLSRAFVIHKSFLIPWVERSGEVDVCHAASHVCPDSECQLDDHHSADVLACSLSLEQTLPTALPYSASLRADSFIELAAECSLVNLIQLFTLVCSIDS